jgi:hypothetical protein
MFIAGLVMGIPRPAENYFIKKACCRTMSGNRLLPNFVFIR